MSTWSTERPERNATVEVQDSAFEVVPGRDNFTDKVKEIAESRGVKNFKVYLNDVEVGPRNAPSTFRAGDVVKIMNYDKAA